MKYQVDAIQWGGGSSRIFPWSPKADAIQWGGGSSRIFPWSPKADAIQWGGGGGSSSSTVFFSWHTESATACCLPSIHHSDFRSAELARRMRVGLTSPDGRHPSGQEIGEQSTRGNDKMRCRRR